MATIAQCCRILPNIAQFCLSIPPLDLRQWRAKLLIQVTISWNESHWATEGDGWQRWVRNAQHRPILPSITQIFYWGWGLTIALLRRSMEVGVFATWRMVAVVVEISLGFVGDSSSMNGFGSSTSMGSSRESWEGAGLMATQGTGLLSSTTLPSVSRLSGTNVVPSSMMTMGVE